MAEPRKAYIASSMTPQEVANIGGIGSSRNKYTTSTTMFLNPTEAVLDTFKEFGKFLGDDTEVFTYEVDLATIDGVWPRVRYQQYNGYELQWRSTYEGKIPAESLTYLNATTKERFVRANSVAP